MNSRNQQPSGSTSANAPSSSNTTGHTKNDLSVHAPLLSSGVGGLSPQPNWPEHEIVSSLVKTQRRVEGVGDDSLLGIPPSSAVIVARTAAGSSGQSKAGKSRGSTTETPLLSSGTEMPMASTGVSYALAIYPYMAEQEDELDIVVGDTFVILSRRKDWWVVQRDPNGTGLVNIDIANQGRAPAGCLVQAAVRTRRPRF
ncbi:hypothetical protein GYMLUDRAFT_47338 [Collybiopsis luxurians FD-317 M1]|uniref:SH3 domain-containing protein n=1 Tax=Collybiopsis luxurians FD-317 M1 TaxID=944289 RepID=A0A0D0CLT6_9AGAR|nr:hypothetical protein GYMLUDRAFT_47338 [Collybiopsis luxurians FD-317 M1]